MSLTEEEAISELSEIDAALPEPSEIAGLSRQEACETYLRVKPKVERVLGWISKIPRYGSRITKVMKVLMAMVDITCDAPGNNCES